MSVATCWKLLEAGALYMKGKNEIRFIERKRSTVKGTCVGNSKSVLIIVFKLILYGDLNVYRVKIPNNSRQSRGYLKRI